MKLVYFALISVQILFGINFVSSKVIIQNIGPEVWTTIRFLSAALLLSLFAFILKRPIPKLNARDFFKLGIISLSGMGVGQNLFMFGLHYSTSTNTSLLSTLIPIITFIMGAFSGRERITFFKVLGLCLAFVGVIVLKDLSFATFSLATIKGDLLVLLGCVCFAYFLIASRDYAQKIDQIWLTAICFGISGLALLPFNLSKLSILKSSFNLTFWQCLVFSIVGATVITYFLNNWCLKRIESSKVALFIYIQPIVTAIVAFFTLNEPISVRAVVASLIIFLGIIFVSKRSLN